MEDSGDATRIYLGMAILNNKVPLAKSILEMPGANPNSSIYLIKKTTNMEIVKLLIDDQRVNKRLFPKFIKERVMEEATTKRRKAYTAGAHLGDDLVKCIESFL